MSEELKSAAQKMGMSDCPTALMMSIDLILKHSPKELIRLTDSFNLTEEEAKAFNDYVETRKK